MDKVTDNVELDFPARMADGRQFTDYRQNCIFNNKLSNGLSSWQYRQYLIQNADNIMNTMVSEQENKTKCTTCKDNTVLPVQTILNCTPTGCNYTLNDSNGLGQYRQY